MAHKEKFKAKETIKKDYNRIFWLSVISLVGIYVGLFIFVSCSKYFNFKYTDWDLAIYNQMYHGALHGRPYSSLLDLSYLGNHVEITSVLLFPIYALFRSALTLLIFQALFLGFAAVPLFMIARDKLNRAWGLVFVIIYLIYPAVGFTNLNEFHPESFLPFIQFLLFYFFLKNNFKKFFLFLLLCVLSKENMSLMMIMFGFYAWIEKKELRWVVAPVISGIIWFFVYKFIIFPSFCGDKIGLMKIYEHLGSNLPQIAKTILLHPVQVIKVIMMPERLSYLLLLFGPLLFLPLLSPLILLIILPNFLQHLLSLRPMEHSIYFYYPSESLAFILIAGVLGLGNLLRFKLMKKFRVFIALALLGSSLYFFLRYWPYEQIYAVIKGSFEKNPVTIVRDKYINSIPEGSRVVSTFKYLPKLSSRTDELYSFHRVLTGTYQFSEMRFTLPDNVDFALIDFDDPFTFGTFYNSVQCRQNFTNFFKDNKWGILAVSDNTFLLKKGVSGKVTACVLLESLPEDVKSNVIVFDDKVQLLAYKMQEEFSDGVKKIHFTFYWQVAKELPEGYLLISTLVDPSLNAPVYSANHPFCYRFYPSLDAKGPQDIIEEHYWLAVPAYVPKGDYRVLLSVFGLSEVLPGKLFSKRGWVDMGAFNQ